MRAVFYERYGTADDCLQVADLPDPDPGPGEVRVRMRASAVNPSDVKSRAGSRGPMAYQRVIPHSDGAGEIDRVGPGVPSKRVGERVWLYEAQWRRPFGTAAELCVVPAARAIPLPEGTSFDEGACLGIPAMTAHRCLFADGPVRDQTVLISGATGRVGAYVVQLAKHAGATVIATVDSGEKGAVALELGADHALDRHHDDVVARVSELTSDRGAERIVEAELGGNFAVDAAVLAPNGSIATYASMAVPEPACPVYPLVFKNATVRFVLVYDMPEAAKVTATREITGLLAQQRLQHRIALTVALEDTAKAHRAVENGVHGCVVVHPSE